MSEHRRKPPQSQPQGGGRAAARRGQPQAGPSAGRRDAPRDATGSPSDRAAGRLPSTAAGETSERQPFQLVGRRAELVQRGPQQLGHLALGRRAGPIVLLERVDVEVVQLVATRPRP